MMWQNLVELISYRGQYQGEKIAYRFLEGEQEKTLTYSQLEISTRQIASLLVKKISPGERAILIYPPGIEFIKAFFGCLYAGVIAVPVYPPTNEKFIDKIKKIIANAGPCVLLTTTELAARLSQLKKIKKVANLPLLGHIFNKLFPYYSNFSNWGLEKLEWITTDAFLQSGPFENIQWPSIKRNDVAFLQYTSGSTGTPKGVMISHGNLLRNLELMRQGFALNESDIMLNWLPPYHNMGLIGTILEPLYMGIESILMSPQTFLENPFQWLTNISKYGATVSGGPNFAYEHCIHNITSEQKQQLDLNSLRVMCNGAEPIQGELLNRFYETFKFCGFKREAFYPSYGLAEATLFVSGHSANENYMHSFDADALLAHKVKPAKETTFSGFRTKTIVDCGIVYPEVAIVNPDSLMRCKGPDIGEIWIHDESVACGYWRREEENRQIFHAVIKGDSQEKRYLRTGDLGFLINEHLFITGRIKDMLIFFGRNYYPQDIETTVKCSHKSIYNSNVAVFTAKDSGKDLVVACEVDKKLNEKHYHQIVNSITKAILEEHGLPVCQIYFLPRETLPKTIGGKICRQPCKIDIENGRLKPIYQWTPLLFNEKDGGRNYSKDHHEKKVEQTVSQAKKYCRERLISELKTTIVAVLKISPSVLDINENWGNFGFDSISFIQFTNRLKRRFEIEIAPTIFFEYPTINKFSNYLLDEHLGCLEKIYQSTEDKFLEPVLFIKNVEAQNNLSVNIPNQTSSDIAIIGMAGVFPNSPNVESFWENLVEACNCISEIPAERWNHQILQDIPKWGGFISDIDKFDEAFFGISPREAALMDPQHRLFLQCVWHSLENAGFTKSKLSQLSVGLFVGVSSQDYCELLQQHASIEAYTATGVAHSILANRVSYLLDLRGPSEAIDTACSSSLVAVHRAIQSIQTGDCEIAIAGGVNALLTPSLYIAFSKAGMLSPEGRCKTFDKDANGYVRGEGVGAIVLKPLARALADKDIIHGVIKGSAVNHGGRVNTLTAPNPMAQAELIKMACRRANVPLNTISFIEAHGTGTALGDPIEINGIKNAIKFFKEERFWDENVVKNWQCGIGTVKTNIGHLEAAAGIAGVIKVLLAMRHKMLPGLVNFQEKNPYIELQENGLYLITKTQEWHALTNQDNKKVPRRAGVSSFGFGGVNAHIVLEEAPEKHIIGEKEIKRKFPSYLFTFSAKNPDALQQKLLDFNVWLKKPSHSSIELDAISYTLNTCRDHFNHRLAIVATSFDDLLEIIENVLRKKPSKEIFLNILNSTEPDDAAICNESLERVSEYLASEHKDLAYFDKNLRIVANLYVKGYEIDWQLLYGIVPQDKIELPLYPFTKNPHWISTAFSLLLPTVQEKIQAQIPPKSLSLEKILDVVKNKLATLTKIPIDQLDIYENLEAYGFDSIIVAEMAKEIGNLIGKKETSLFFAARTLHDLASRIYEQYEVNLNQPIKEIEVCHLNPNEDDVAIIGMAGCYPQSNDLYELYENLAQGKDLIIEVPKNRWNYNDYYEEGLSKANKTYGKWGSFIDNVDNFDYELFKMSYNEAGFVHPEERLFLQQAWSCFESAGYDPLQWLNQKNNKIGVYAGASFHDYQYVVMEANQKYQLNAPYTSQTYSYANRLSYYFNLTGPSVTLDTACSSSLFAIYEAYHAIRQGRCSMALAGGVNLNLHPSKYILLSQFNFMSKDGKCHAFTEGGSGYVPGEGIGLILMKRLSEALRDRDNILAVIKSAVANNDGKTNGFTVPDPDAQYQIIREAMEQSGLKANQIDFIECHGTGTPLGDPIEISALTKAFANDTTEKQFCPISSIKANIGHLEAAAGIAQITKVILQFQSQQLFPNVMHHARLNSNISFAETPFYVQDRLSAWQPHPDIKCAGISSFGAGGTNVHMILEEFKSGDKIKSNEDEKNHQIVPLSADTEEQLIEMIQKLYLFLAKKRYQIFNNDYSVLNIAGTLQRGRAIRSCKLAIVCENSLKSLLQELEKIVETYYGQSKILIKENVFYQSSSSMGPFEQSPRAYKDLLLLADKWTRGHVLHWENIIKHYQKVYLPGYCFKRNEFNLHSPSKNTEDIRMENDENSAKLKITETLSVIFKNILGKLPVQFDKKITFDCFGIDSITGSRIQAELVKIYPGLDDFALFEHNTFEKLINHLYGSYYHEVKTEVIEEAGKIGELLTSEKIETITETDIITMPEFIQTYEKTDGAIKICIDKVVLSCQKSIEIVTAGEGEPVFFLPPFNSTAIIWIHQILYLSQYFKVVVVHYPGIGSSDWIEDLLDFDHLAAILVDLIDQMRIAHLIKPHPVALVGWSFGGFLGQAIAAKYPDYLRQLVLVSTTAISWSSQEYKLSGEEFSVRSAEQFNTYYNRLPDFVQNMPQVKRLYSKNKLEMFVFGTIDKRILTAYFRMIAKFRHLNIAQQIKTKTYLITGNKDDLMPPQYARQLHQQITNSEYFEVPNGEHFMSLFNENIINRKLLEWLRLGLNSLLDTTKQ